jgi:hypothetical protein
MKTLLKNKQQNYFANAEYPTARNRLPLAEMTEGSE